MGGTPAPIHSKTVAISTAAELGEEAMALRIGWAYEQATDWKQRRPPEPPTAKP